MVVLDIFVLGIGCYIGWSVCWGMQLYEKADMIKHYFLLALLLTLVQPLIQAKDDFHMLAQTGKGLSDLAQAIGSTAEKTSGFFDFGTPTKPLGSSFLDQLIPFRGGKFSIPVKGEISQGFGPDNHGLDIKASMGDPVQAAKDGKIVTVNKDNVYGLYIIADHGSGYQTLYAHLSAVSVKIGESVFEKDVIGKIGSTGNSTGPHLHFEIRYKNQAVDPTKYLRGK